MTSAGLLLILGGFGAILTGLMPIGIFLGALGILVLLGGEGETAP